MSIHNMGSTNTNRESYVSTESSESSESTDSTDSGSTELSSASGDKDGKALEAGLTISACESSEAESGRKEEPVEEWTATRQEWFIMGSLSMISLVVALDATILVTVLPTIAKALNGSSNDAFWAGTSYLLSSAISQPIIASISQLFGRQQLLLISLFCFTLGTLFCAIAPGFTLLLVGRSIQGIGGGGIITMGQVIFCDIVPLRVRPKYFSMVLGSWAIGSIIGPVIGGVLCENTSWRWCFYINFPFCLLGFILATIFVRLQFTTTLTLREKVKRTDFVGISLFIVGMTAFLVGISWGGVQFKWNSVQVLTMISAGVLALILFVFSQRWKKAHSLLPMSIFHCPSALAAFYCAVVNGFLLFTALYYCPFYLLAVKSKSPTDAGILLFPALFFLLPGSIIVAALTARLGRFRWAVWMGWAFTTLACGLLILLDENSSMVLWVAILAHLGIGLGMVLTSVNVGIQAISRVEDSAMAASMYGFMRSLGMPIGVAIAGTVFQNSMAARLSDFQLPATIAEDSERFIYVLRAMEPHSKYRPVIINCYVHGFRSVWILMTAVSGSALLVSFIIRRYSMDKGVHSTFSAR